MLKIVRDARGAAAIEFALLAPALIMFIVGIAQLGVLFFANASLNNAIAEGARYATIYPRPTTTQIRQKIASSHFGLDTTRLSTPAISYGNVDGANYADIQVTYSVPLDFIFFTLPAVTLTEQRRVFVQPNV